MSQLWACYVADNVERFRKLLALTGHSAQAAAVWNANNLTASGGGSGDVGGGTHATSPRGVAGKSRKASGYGIGGGQSKSGGGGGIGKNEINSRDHAGLTILLRAASSTSENALAFVQALLEHPSIDLYVQDPESGWNALHRALYAGNIAIARLLLQKERMDIAGQTLGAPVGRIGQLIKTKDNEGNSPFDLYNSTIGERLNEALDEAVASDDDSDDDDIVVKPNRQTNTGGLQALVDGEDLFFFGSNKNLTLGMGDGDDRQFPERIYLHRPDHLLYRFYSEYLEKMGHLDETNPMPSDVTDLPAWIRGQPLLIHDVVLSKLHSAILTTDPVSNLYMCGIGRGGRLGLGDENTRFSFEPVQGPLADKKIATVALGLNHSMAVTDNGQLWTWGSNAHSQLGYALPPPAKLDEDPMTSVPRQVFGPLRKEAILGVAASAWHSVAHTGGSLYCWGKNVGQLALMDADSRSLDVQAVPRKVAASLFSAPIVSVSAIDKATTCLLANHTVCVFTSYGYSIVKFNFAETFSHSARLGNLSMSSRYDPGRSQINYIASGGDTIAAVTSRGDLFTMHLANVSESSQTSASTTNPSKIRDSITTPQCIWNARKDGVRSVGVGEQGSVIISTHSGAVWRRIKRAKAKDAHVGNGTRKDTKKKDYKFQRVPFITNVAAVRSSAFGAFAAIRCDSNVIKERTGIDAKTLWEDVAPLSVLEGFESSEPGLEDTDRLRFWDAEVIQQRSGPVAYQVLRGTDLEADLEQHLSNREFAHRGEESLGMVLRTSLAPALRIPVHSWIVCARSGVLRDALARCREGDGTFKLSDVFYVETEDAESGRVFVITFVGLDLIGLLNLVNYVYTDKDVPVWNYARQASNLAHRYRQVRVEVMKLATRLNMPHFETAVRIQTEPKRTMDDDFRAAVRDARFFDDADAVLELNGAEVPVHSVFLCQRCPWFEGLFHGRSRGQWLASRRDGQTSASQKLRLDLKHMDPQSFQYVLRFLYTDTDDSLFDSLVAPDFESFYDRVLDVLGIANELMLDRLSQVCQVVIGQYAGTRNISHLLNTVSMCSVSEFKDAGLEYICLQMETMLENHLLDDLDDDLLRDLDAVVRDNQTTQMPFSRSSRAEMELHEKYPELAQDIDEERQRRVREMAFKAAHRDDDWRRGAISSSFKSRAGSVDDGPTLATSPAADRANSSRRRSRGGRTEPSSPGLRPQSSHADLIFSMEEEEEMPCATDSPSSAGVTRPRSRGKALAAAVAVPGTFNDESPSVSAAQEHGSLDISVSSPNGMAVVHRNAGGRGLGFMRRGTATMNAADMPPSAGKATAPGAPMTPKVDHGGNPWGSPAMASTSKLDLRTIMTESTSSSLPMTLVTRTSTLSAGLDAQRAVEVMKPGGAAPVAPVISTPKMSQKERKRQQQQQQQMQSAAKSVPKTPAWDMSPTPGEGKRPGQSWQASPSPQRPAGPGPAKTPTHSLAPDLSSSPAAAASTTELPLNVLANPATKKLQHRPRAASPDTRFSGQPRSLASAGTSASAARPPAPAPASPSAAVPLVPHSKVYIKPAPKAEPILGLTMADIFLQQQLDKESSKAALAKRSLQEIQAEQAFQEWWDQETRRLQDEETQRQTRDEGRKSRGGRGGRGGSKATGGSGPGSAGRNNSVAAADAGTAGGSGGEARGASRKGKLPEGPGKTSSRAGGERQERGGGSRSQRGGRGGSSGQGGQGIQRNEGGQSHGVDAVAGGKGGSGAPRRRGGGGGRGGKAGGQGPMHA